MKKRVSGLILLAALFFVLLPGPARAADYEAERLDDGSVRVVNSDTDEVLATLSLRLGTVNQEIAVKGSLIYFTGYVNADNSYSNSLYAYNYKTKKQVQLKALPSTFPFYDVNEVYDGSVYLTGWSPSDDTALYRWNIKKEKLTAAAEDGYAFRYKKYIVCDSRKVHGSFVTYPVHIYNTKTGKTVATAKNVAAYSYKKGKLYIAQMPKYKYPESSKAKYKIFRYDIKRGKKKTLKKKLKAYMIDMVTSKYVFHRKGTYKNGVYKSTFYRTTIKTGKSKTMNLAQYTNAMGY